MHSGQRQHEFHVLAAVTFHFRANRLQYLFQVVRALTEYDVDLMNIVIVTNVNDNVRIDLIKNLCSHLLVRAPFRKMRKQTLTIQSFPI